MLKVSEVSKVVLLSVMVVIMTGFSGMSSALGSNTSQLTQRWLLANGVIEAIKNPDNILYLQNQIKSAGFPITLELLKNGTGIIDENISMTWKVERNRIFFDYELNYRPVTRAFNYTLSNHTLPDGTLTQMLNLVNNGGVRVQYVTPEGVVALHSEIKAERENAEATERRRKAAFPKGEFVDSRDGKKYRTVKIGDKTWMAENLNYTIPPDTIVSGRWIFRKITINAKSYCYNNNENNCQKYGQLYEWNEAIGACPAGWRLSNGDDWKNLPETVAKVMAVAEFIDTEVSRDEAAAVYMAVFEEFGFGAVLKSETGWENVNIVGRSGGGQVDIGFSALPGGFYITPELLENGTFTGNRSGFVNVGLTGKWWWSATTSEGDQTLNSVFMENNSNELLYGRSPNKGIMLSIRCVKESMEQAEIAPKPEPKPMPIAQPPVQTMDDVIQEDEKRVETAPKPEPEPKPEPKPMPIAQLPVRTTDDVMQESRGRVETTPKEKPVAESSIKTSFWAGIGLEVLGAGIIVYGLIENENVKTHSNNWDYTKADKSARSRNIAYIIGTAALLSGISIHIFF